MSKKKIVAALSAKGLKVANVEYVRSEPTPYGYARGWDIALTEESENKLFEVGFNGVTEPDCYDSKEALEWVESLPDCGQL